MNKDDKMVELNTIVVNKLASLTAYGQVPFVVAFQSHVNQMLDQARLQEDNILKAMMMQMTFEQLQKNHDGCSTNNQDQRLKPLIKHIFSETTEAIAMQKQAIVAAEECMSAAVELVFMKCYMTQTGTIEWKSYTKDLLQVLMTKSHAAGLAAVAAVP